MWQPFRSGFAVPTLLCSRLLLPLAFGRPPQPLHTLKVRTQPLPAEEGDEDVVVHQSSEEDRDRLDTLESLDFSTGDHTSIKSRDSFDCLSLTQMMMMNKDELVNEIKKHNRGKGTDPVYSQHLHFHVYPKRTLVDPML